MILQGWVGLTHVRPGVKALVLWHDESGAEMGDCHAPIGRRAGDGFVRAARGAGATGANAFNAAAVGPSGPHRVACGRRCGCSRECRGTGRMAEDRSSLAQAVADGDRWDAGARTAGRRAPSRRAAHVSAPADLCDLCDDVREAGGKRSAHQPLEPARDCRRGDTTRLGSERLAALGGAFFKKKADLKPDRLRYWLTPQPDPAFDAQCADICEVYQAAAGADEGHRTVSIDEMNGIQALERIAPGLPMKPGEVERCEFEYRRHGTQTLIAGFDVTIGKIAGGIGDTRTEQDFARFLDTLLSSAAANTGGTSSATTSTSISPSPSFALLRSIAA